MSEYFFHVSCFREIAGDTEWMFFVQSIVADGYHEACMQLGEIVEEMYPGWKFYYSEIGSKVYDNYQKVQSVRLQELMQLKVVDGGYT